MTKLGSLLAGGLLALGLVAGPALAAEGTALPEAGTDLGDQASL